jgi:hypothetical protein
MYTPPILYATQDDINERRRVRKEFRDNERQSLIKSIHTVTKRDKFEKSLKAGNKDKDQKKKKKDKKKKKKKKSGQANLVDENGNDSDDGDDLLEKNSTYREIQHVVDIAATAGPVHIVRLMRANPANYKILTLCCGSLGDMASFSRRDQISQDKGIFLSRNAQDYHSPTSHIAVAIGQADGIKAIMDVMVKHRAKEGLVIRGLWALEHILEVDENWLKFVRQGGHQRLELVAEVEYIGPTAKKIAAALKKLKNQPVQGDDVRSQFCRVL